MIWLYHLNMCNVERISLLLKLSYIYYFYKPFIRKIVLNPSLKAKYDLDRR